jgi:hypothetical protein
LDRQIAEMGGVAEKMVVEAVDALANADTVLARQVVSTDPIRPSASPPGGAATGTHRGWRSAKRC